jgi:hypothetical protein
LWALCDGIYAMIQQIETLTTERPDGLHGWANMLDIWKCAEEFLPWLAQFVGAMTKSGLTEQQQREYIYSLPGFNRGRPSAIIAAVKAAGPQFVRLVERRYLDGTGVWQDNAWRYTVITKPSETSDPAAVQAAIQSQKPGPDQGYWKGIEAATYAWVALEYSTYADVMAAYPTYAALRDAQIS